MPDWRSIAEEEVRKLLDSLPREIAEAARPVTILIERTPPADLFDGDLLGLCEGCSLLDGAPQSLEEMPKITLFCETLAEEAEWGEAAFRQEVRLTFLHELGHYLGWDEDEVARRGLA